MSPRLSSPKSRRRLARSVSTLAMLIVPLVCFGQNVERMEEVIQARVDDMAFMGTVLVARGSETLLNEGYGSANLEWDIPNTPSTKFRLGSVTKQFTAASILLLEERGELAVDDLLKQHLSDVPAAWDEITIHHVLTHTAGIPSITSFPEFQTLKLSPMTVEQSVALVRDKPLEFTPGERMNYSNSGYILLGHLIETISGQDYESFLQENFFEPLGMRDTGLDVNARILSRRAAGYSPGASGMVNAPFVDMSLPHGAGALYSTTEDLLRWTRGLFGGDLLSEESLEKMTTPFKNDYAYGVQVSEVGGRTVVEHGGGIEGFNTHLAYYPESEATVAVLGNLNGGAPGTIAAQLGAVLHGESVVLPSERQEITLAPEALRKFVGTYELAPTANMIISFSDGQLIGQLGPQPPLALVPETATRFFPRGVDAYIEFEQDASGAVTALVLHQGGGEQRAPRIGDRVEMDLPPGKLTEYAGTYELGPGVELAISVDDGRLMSQATGQPSAQLFAEAEDEFFLKSANAQITFRRNAGGRVEALILHQGGNDIRAPKR